MTLLLLILSSSLHTSIGASHAAPAAVSGTSRVLHRCATRQPDLPVALTAPVDRGADLAASDAVATQGEDDDAGCASDSACSRLWLELPRLSPAPPHRPTALPAPLRPVIRLC